MPRHPGWHELADVAVREMSGAIGAREVTYDFARGPRDPVEEPRELLTPAFGDAVMRPIGRAVRGPVTGHLEKRRVRPKFNMTGGRNAELE